MKRGPNIVTINMKIAVLLYGDTKVDNEWGILLNNLYNHKTYAIYELENKLIPSSYMPPLYPFILLFDLFLHFVYLHYICVPFS